MVSRFRKRQLLKKEGLARAKYHQDLLRGCFARGSNGFQKLQSKSVKIEKDVGFSYPILILRMLRCLLRVHPREASAQSASGFVFAVALAECRLPQFGEVAVRVGERFIGLQQVVDEIGRHWAGLEMCRASNSVQQLCLKASSYPGLLRELPSRSLSRLEAEEFNFRSCCLRICIFEWMPRSWRRVIW
jgi:hypothetical protein